jgi:hypothetical protein
MLIIVSNVTAAAWPEIFTLEKNLHLETGRHTSHLETSVQIAMNLFTHDMFPQTLYGRIHII